MSAVCVWGGLKVIIVQRLIFILLTIGETSTKSCFLRHIVVVCCVFNKDLIVRHKRDKRKLKVSNIKV